MDRPETHESFRPSFWENTKRKPLNAKRRGGRKNKEEQNEFVLLIVPKFLNKYDT